MTMLQTWHIILILFFIVTATPPLKYCHDDDGNIKILSREKWKSRSPTRTAPMKNPVQYVVIHHSYIPGPCNTSDTCEQAMREMQDMHMDRNKWSDIGYSFAVGGDGCVYEGRGWSTVGTHAPGYNSKSIGICNIGDFRSFTPPAQQMSATKALIEIGVKQGWISEDYKLIGHRQTKATECPGQAFFDEIKTWPHFAQQPEDP